MAVIALCLLSPAGADAEFSVGGYVTVSAVNSWYAENPLSEGVTLPGVNFPVPNPFLPLTGSVSDADAEGGVKATMVSEAFQAALDASFAFTRTGLATIALNELWVRGDLDGVLFLKIGRWVPLSSPALMFPRTDFLSPKKQDAIFKPEIKHPNLPEDLLEFRVVADFLSISVALAPFRPEVAYPDLDSVWFTGKGIPKEQKLGTTVMKLSSLDFHKKTPPIQPVYDPSYSATFALTTEWFDAKLSSFQGLEREPAWSAFIDIQNSSQFVYNVHLYPMRTSVSSLGASLTIPIDSIRIFADTAITFNRTFASKEIVIELLDTDPYVIWKTKTVNLDPWSVSGGVMWTADFMPLTVVAEATWTEIPEITDDVTPALLDRAAGMAISTSPFGEWLKADILAIMSLRDSSWAVVPKLTWSPVPDSGLSLSVPFFSGGPDSELGQFSPAEPRLMLAAFASW